MTRSFSCTYSGASNNAWRILLWCKTSHFAHLVIHPTSRELGWFDYSFHGWGVIVPDSTSTTISFSQSGTIGALTVNGTSYGTQTMFDVESNPFGRVGEGSEGYLPLATALYPSDILYPSDTLYPLGDTSTYCNGTLTGITVSDDGPQFSRLGVANPEQTTITSYGDSETGVVITITGPCGIPIVTNQTIGEFVKWNGSLASGDVLVIDTNNATVYLNGVNALSSLDINSDFWQLQPGDNSISCTENGSPTAVNVVVSWSDKYVGF